MKNWFKSLFPFRWIIPMLFIILTSILITYGFLSPKGNDTDYFQNPFLWYGGNFIGWFIVDYLFGLGREGVLFKIKNDEKI